jgi:6-phosphogluconolactonase
MHHVLHHDLEVLADPSAVAAAAADQVVRLGRAAIADHGRFTFAVSGGHTPWAMFADLAHHDIAWRHVVVFQVDERIAPAGDPDRNLTHLRQSLKGTDAQVVPMPVNDTEPTDLAGLDDAAEGYAALLPDRLDLVHLGLGPDGHTASLVPGDPVLEVTDRLVGITAAYQGHQRMTLTYPALARADQLLWLVTGAEKRAPLVKLLVGDRSIPAGRVDARASLVLADRAAADRAAADRAAGGR